MNVGLRFRALVALFCIPFVEVNAAVWTNSQGRSFEAHFVRMQGTKVVFAMADGKKFLTPLLQLSPESQAVIRGKVSRPIEQLRSNFGRP